MQLSFSFGARSPERTWATGRAVDRSGGAAFIILIRSPDDPERSPRPRGGRGDKAPHRTLRKGSLEALRRAIVDLLADAEPRTFNRITVELLDLTADVCFDELPEHALWSLVDEELVEHTLEAPILFRLRRRLSPRVVHGLPLPSRT